MDRYIFTSERLGFRNWEITDIDVLFKINSDDSAMQFFPSKPSKTDTKNFIERMQQQYTEKGFCYFAVEVLDTKECIGFIGISEQTYEIDFNPSIDIGWRIHPDFWGKGFATEGAKVCLQYAFKQLNLNEIVSVAPKINIPSIAVMKKIGMTKAKEFTHPKLLDSESLKDCVLYKIKNNSLRNI